MTVQTKTAADNCRQFLEDMLAFPGPDGPGYVNIHWPVPAKDAVPDKNGKVREIWLGDFGKTVTEILKKIDRLAAKDPPVNIFFCTSVQSQTKLNKHKNMVAWKCQENAQSINSIFTDVDVKEGGYDSIEAATRAIVDFCLAAPMPEPSYLVGSGGGLHVYWLSDRPLTRDEWQPYANGLKALLQKHGVKCDFGVTSDSARVLRVPGTLNLKTKPYRPVTIRYAGAHKYDFATALAHLPKAAPVTATVTRTDAAEFFDPSIPTITGPLYGLLPEKILEHEERLLDPRPIFKECPHLRKSLETGGKDRSQPEWHLEALASTFFQNGESIFHTISKEHKDYTPENTDAMYQRKLRDREGGGLGYPSCQSFKDAGSKECEGCPLWGAIRSPLNIKPPPAPQAEPSFVDPYAEFTGPAFPLDVLPPTLARFVGAEHRAMGADPSAIAMAVLTTVAGAIHAKTRVRVGEGWWEKPIVWTALVGPPSTMKSPVVDKTTRPLSRIDHERQRQWELENAQRQKDTTGTKGTKTTPPPKPPRCIINDATPEKVAEILSRAPSGSLMVHDELAGLLGSFERYTSGQSCRGFYLTCWNGGTHLKDRVGKGRNDPDAEIRVDNLALCILGGIQPDRLEKLGDLTSDGLLQRYLPVLMQAAERGDEYYPVADAEDKYEQLIKSINDTAPKTYDFADDALDVRDRVIDHLHKLEQVNGFPPALIGAIGKMKGYFARVCLVLQVARQHDPVGGNDELSFELPEGFTRAEGKRLCELWGLDPAESLSAGLNTGMPISCQTAEAAEKVIREFLLPHIFGLYDVVVKGGQDRDMVRSIGDFILSSHKSRLRPSDLTAGVRALRGQPEHKIREWASRFCAMGWLQPEEEKSGLPPKAWQVLPGLREHFAERCKKAQAARAEAHTILKAGGSRRPAPARV